MKGDGKRTFVEVVGRAGQWQGYPSCRVQRWSMPLVYRAMVCLLPSYLKFSMRLLKASLQARPLPAFVLEIVRVDVLVDFGGNLRKWRRQLEMLKGEVVRALELVEEELFE